MTWSIVQKQWCMTAGQIGEKIRWDKIRCRHYTLERDPAVEEGGRRGSYTPIRRLPSLPAVFCQSFMTTFTLVFSWGRVLWRNWDKSQTSIPHFDSQSLLLTDFTPPSKSGLKLVCNVNIVYGNIKYENSQDYAETPQQNCAFMNSTSARRWRSAGSGRRRRTMTETRRNTAATWARQGSHCLQLKPLCTNEAIVYKWSHCVQIKPLCTNEAIVYKWRQCFGSGSA